MCFSVADTVLGQSEKTTDPSPKAEKRGVFATSGGNVMRHCAEYHIAEGCHLEQPDAPEIGKKIYENEQYRESEKHEIQVIESVYSRKGAGCPSSDRQTRFIPPILEITHFLPLNHSFALLSLA